VLPEPEGRRSAVSHGLHAADRHLNPYRNAAGYPRVGAKASRKSRPMKIPARVRHLRHTHNHTYAIIG
jgi:hypothetical protein